MNRQQWLTAEETAGFLKVKPATIRAWARAGLIPSYRLPAPRPGAKPGDYRFLADEIEELMRGTRTGNPRSEAIKSSGFTYEQVPA